MNDMMKTTTFLAVALVVVLVAVLTGPSWRPSPVEDVRGELLDPQFDDPREATSLEIVEFDDDLRQRRPFTVARTKGQWSIPSHEDYPADAEGQLGKAAASLLGLQILSVESDAAGNADATRGIYNQYGVVDPDSAKPSDEGVGTRVTMKDRNGAELVSLVIGKEVPDQSELRYVRHVGKSKPVYVVKFDTGKLSTKFEDWIEDDLLKLSTWDINRIEIQDYTVGVLGNQLFSDMKGQMTLEYDDAGDPKWKLTENVAIDKEKGPVPVEMAEDEELDTDKLNGMTSAMDNLKIVDVQRKPPGLSMDLKVEGTLTNDLQTTLSLQQRGFYFVPVTVGNEKFLQLLSNKGEIRVVMKDGVEYVLRFGEVAGAGAEKSDETDADQPDKAGETADDSAGQNDGGTKGENAEKEAAEEGEDSKPGMNRYLFLMAEFNPNVIPKPELEELPKEEPKPDEQPDARAAEGTTEEKAGDATTEAKAEEKDAEEKDAEEKDAEENAEKDDLAKERERIEKENKRKQEAYQKKIEEGQNKVKELNGRFADWYYVISDEVYEKIHLGRDEIVKKKEKEEGKKEGQAEDAAVIDMEPTEQEADKPADPLEEFEKLKKEGPGGAE